MKMIVLLAISLALISGSILVLVRVITAVRKIWRLPMVIIIFGLTVALALTVGIRWGTFQTFQISDDVRIQGVPIPVVIFVREEQNWTDFVEPLPVGYVYVAANALFPVGIMSLFWTLTLKCLMRKRASCEQVRPM